MTEIKAKFHTVKLDGDPGPFRAELSVEAIEPGVEHVHLTLVADAPQTPPRLALAWDHPSIDIQSHWDPSTHWNRGVNVEWAGTFPSKATTNAPVTSLFDQDGRNRLTFAFSDALNPCAIQAGIHEETARFTCAIKMFNEPGPPIARYEATLRLDTRELPYYESLDHVRAWWESLPGYTPAPVPEAARRPMYSTWYSAHQNVTPDWVEAQCRIAKELGCEAVIVDDGWQTSNSGRGYNYCGDWEVSPERIPDMRAHVARVHALGMKYLLWYSVPYVGVHSKACERFKGKFLSDPNAAWAGVVDPRFPEVREYLIDIYERAMREWDLDGFKLDFVDSFYLHREHENELGNGRDMDSVPQAVDTLLTEVMERLRKINPEVMIEFRQTYIGPLMRKYGNMFRASDCPNDALGNRVRTIDVRLICGNTAAHADMMMWNPDEPVESAALQQINALFSVPQISVLLDKIPADHYEMVAYWLAFWKAHRDVLLDGVLSPLSPAAAYPIVVAENKTKRLIAVYLDMVVDPGDAAPAEVWLVNGSRRDRVVLDIHEALGTRRLTVRDCRGRLVTDEPITLGKGLQQIAVPPSGTASLIA